METPKTQYADCDGSAIAFQVFGRGDKDLIYVPGTMSNVELAWDDRRNAAFLRGLGENHRVICFDKRGHGVSDPIQGVPSFEERMDDLRAVMDAAHSTSATLFGTSEGGPMCALFAATYPDKVDGLVLYGSMAKFVGNDEYPYMPEENIVLNFVPDIWGTPAAVRFFAPDLLEDEEAVAESTRFMRQSGSPNAIRQLYRANAPMDIRAVLPMIRIPTLIMHRRDEFAIKHHNSRYLADHIPNAIYLELPGRNHAPWVGDWPTLIQAVEIFSSTSVAASGDQGSQQRQLATVLFTDIVDSTAMLAETGDDGWRKFLDRHDEISQNIVASFQGRLVKNTGDGILAVFNGPARAIRCAGVLRDRLSAIGIPIRAGLHVGEIKKRGEDVTGLVIHIAARVMEYANRGEVLVTRTLADLTADQGLNMESRGRRQFKGLPEETEILIANDVGADD
ncbi:MAG: adenylate/guanylate cyclase domain-containing protein [Rhodospirillales bacterium]|jgi:pimeloyl-ACP methyl ester carboxylesterase/class 3 adenylate cyclase|nr:adenylate/guanylate cyclase domain-containing protein [Rhodospirillales bacterium]